MPAIKPEEVVKAKEKIVPEFVFEAFNECIAKHIQGKRSEFTQDSVIEAMYRHARLYRYHGIDNGKFRQKIFAERWLDVEPIYREAGWAVAYDKPAYNETYPATFIFTAP